MRTSSSLRPLALEALSPASASRSSSTLSQARNLHTRRATPLRISELPIWLPQLRTYPEAQQQIGPRPFSSSSRRSNTGHEAYHGALPEYSKSQSSKGSKPWYRSPTTLVLGFIPIFTFGLGYWQIKRLKWKLGLIEELEDKLRKESLRLPKNINLDVLPEFDFRLVSLKGKYDHSRTMFLGPRVREGVLGFHIVTPLHRAEGGGMVLVNRGFVSEKAIQGSGPSRHLKEEAMPKGEVEFVALLPRVYPPNAFTPDNKPQNNSWFHADPAEMAKWASEKADVPALSLSNDAAEDHWTSSSGVSESVKGMLGIRGSAREEDRVLPVYLEEVFDGNVGEASARIWQGVPVGRAANIELRNQHAVYAATWFSLSACTAVMFGILVKRGR